MASEGVFVTSRQAGKTSAEEQVVQGAARQQQSTAAQQRHAGETLDAFIARTEHLSSENPALEDHQNDQLIPVRRLLHLLL